MWKIPEEKEHGEDKEQKAEQCDQHWDGKWREPGRISLKYRQRKDFFFNAKQVWPKSYSQWETLKNFKKRFVFIILFVLFKQEVDKIVFWNYSGWV